MCVVILGPTVAMTPDSLRTTAPTEVLKPLTDVLEPLSQEPRARRGFETWRTARQSKSG